MVPAALLMLSQRRLAGLRLRDRAWIEMYASASQWVWLDCCNCCGFAPISESGI